jgi:hypothetical protein
MYMNTNRHFISHFSLLQCEMKYFLFNLVPRVILVVTHETHQISWDGGGGGGGGGGVGREHFRRLISDGKRRKNLNPIF